MEIGEKNYIVARAIFRAATPHGGATAEKAIVGLKVFLRPSERTFQSNPVRSLHRRPFSIGYLSAL